MDADFREAMSVREGTKVRRGRTHMCIEVWSINRKCWMPQMLPGSGTLFTNKAERAAVMRRLEGK